jgi:hypothetical protein
MDDDLVSALAAEREELKNKSKTIHRELKAARRHEKNEERKASKAWQLTTFITHVLLILFVRADEVAAPASVLLAQTAKKKQWPAKSDEELTTIIVDLYLQSDPADVAGLVDENNPSDPEAMRDAVRWSEEWGLVCQVEALNYKKGLAPPTELVLRMLEQRRAALPEWCRPTHKGDASESRARSWARRWRQRWGGKHGKVRIREDISLEEMRNKVRDLAGSWPRKRDRFELARRDRFELAVLKTITARPFRARQARPNRARFWTDRHTYMCIYICINT